MSSIKKQAISGLIWTVLSYGGGQALRFASNLVLTRLLFPELFGLMTLINTFITGLYLFSDTGVGPSIIRHKRGDDPLFLNTAWTVQVVRGIFLWFFCLALTPVVAHFYQEPQFNYLLPVAGLTTIITGFESTSRFTLNRQMGIRLLSIFELGGQALSIGVFIIWAYFSPTIWALVGGNVLSLILKTIWSHFLIPGYSNRFAWDKDVAQELFSFGRWIFLSTAMTFLAGQSDRIILGKLLTFSQLGVYNIAAQFSLIPHQVVNAMSDKVFFPVFSKFADLPRDEFRNKIKNKRKQILLLSALFLSLLAASGDLLISVLYDSRYQDAAWMMPILTIGVWPSILTQTVDSVLLAIGKPQYISVGTFAKSLYLFILIPLTFHAFGLVGPIIVIAFNDLPFYTVINYGLYRERLSFLWQDLWITMVLIVLLTVMILIRHLIGLDWLGTTPLPDVSMGQLLHY